MKTFENTDTLLVYYDAADIYAHETVIWPVSMQTPVIFQFNGPKCFLISQLNFKKTETKLSQVV